MEAIWDGLYIFPQSFKTPEGQESLKGNFGQKTVGQKLFDMSSGCIRALQFLGYLHCSVNHDNKKFVTWDWKWSTLYFIFNAVICVSVPCTTIMVQQRTAKVLSMTPTETFCVVLDCITFLFLKLYFVSAQYVKRGSSARFWNLHLDKAEAFTQIVQHFKIGYGVNSHEINPDTRRLFQAVLIILTAILCWHVFYFYADFWKPLPDTPTPAFLYIATVFSFFWLTLFYLHASYSVYLTFYLKFYTGCVKLINSELRDLKIFSNNCRPARDSSYEVRNIVAENSAVQRISSCLHAYHLVGELVREFNVQFAKDIIVELMTAVTAITSCTFFMLIWGVDKVELQNVVLLLPALPFALEIFWLSSQAAALEAEARFVIHNLSLLPLDESIPPSLLFQVIFFKFLASLVIKFQS